MESIKAFFDDIPSLYRSLILVGGLMFFWMLEGVIPLFRFKYNKLKHAGINLFFTLTTLIVNFAFALAIVKTSDWAVASNFGLLNMVDMPLWLYLLAGMLLLDLVGAYFIHWMEHKVKWMWKFHLVHHADTHVDTTTANRHHPGESVFRAAFTLLAVIATGADMWVVMVYQSMSALLSQFNHANFRLPRVVDNTLSWLIVSPNMHKVHHHYTQPLTDTNYGNIFSIWDRIFGTFVYVPDMNTLVYGIDTHMKPEENARIGNLLKIPFQEYRPPVGKFSDHQTG
jgi:sterol desaturase/sphingolipid hydroxylase (fatty acid hydroxylase superfamily)